MHRRLMRACSTSTPVVFSPTARGAGKSQRREFFGHNISTNNGSTRTNVPGGLRKIDAGPLHARSRDRQAARDGPQLMAIVKSPRTSRSWSLQGFTAKSHWPKE